MYKQLSKYADKYGSCRIFYLKIKFLVFRLIIVFNEIYSHW